LDSTTYHIYAKDKVLYCNLPQEEFEEKWELLHVMVDLLESKYSADDLSYIRLGPKCGVGGPGRVVSVENDMYNKCEWEEDSY
tara:strand:- start:4119 stop:4367 length:249 start_codon:yes stop_codon:yes gene_type:complete